MRIWDLAPQFLCRVHLLGEHRELHALWAVITKNKKGYKNHPETKRWIGKLKALYQRHELLVIEMQKRKYRHQSPLDQTLATGRSSQDFFLATIEEQKNILVVKACHCQFLWQR